MRDTLDAIAYLGGLIFGLCVLFGIIIVIFLILVSKRLDKMHAQWDQDLADYERGYDES